MINLFNIIEIKLLILLERLKSIKFNIILGATIDQFLDGQKIKKYNSVLQISSDSLSYYHKSKLVQGEITF